MCIICVSTVTAASLLSPTQTVEPQNLEYKYVSTKKTCTKSKLNKTVGGKICLKDGTKYRWFIKETSAKPIEKEQEVDTQKDVYSAPSVPTSDINLCKIKEVSRSRGMTGAGFPEWNSLTAKTGTVKWALIPIQFSDLSGESNFKSRIIDQTKMLSDWFFMASDGKFKVEWVISDKWITIQNSASSYNIAFSSNLNKELNGIRLFNDAMTASDKSFDFTNIQTVNFILPNSQTFLKESSQGFPWDQAVKEFVTNEGKISSFSIPGTFFDQPGREYWSYWVHEFGHAIGLPHIGTSRPDPNGKINPINFNELDIMGIQDVGKELSGWLRFFIGWLSDERIYCKQSDQIENIQLSLLPLSTQEDGLKLVIIPLSDTKAILIESRRINKFSCSRPNHDGVLVYTYNAELGHNEDFLVQLVPAGRYPERTSCAGNDMVDPFLNEGDYVIIEGVKIKVIKQGSYDRIEINKDLNTKDLNYNKFPDRG